MRFDLILNLRLFEGSTPSCGLGSLTTPVRGDLSPDVEATQTSVVSVPPNASVPIDTSAMGQIVLLGITTDRKITVAIDGEETVVDRLPSMAAGYMVLTTDTAGPVVLTNNGGSAAKVAIVLAGRP